MQIKVVLHSVLRDRLPKEANGQTELTLPENGTAADVFTQLKIPNSMWCAVNGSAEGDPSRPLRDGDVVDVFMRLGGG